MGEPTSIQDVIRALARPDEPWVGETATAFLNALEAGVAAASPIRRALLAGARADRLGFAFAAGYTSALALLGGETLAARGLRLPALRACFAATEGAGAHPRAIQTELRRDGGESRLDGTKNWVTFGHEASHAIVIAREGERDGRPVLRAVLVRLDGPGVLLSETPPPPFVPEIGHAKLTLTGVRVEGHFILPGDGYADWLKPFRTVEDLCVHAALVGYLAGVVRRADGPPRAMAELAAMAIALDALGDADRSAPVTHVALEGVIGLTESFLERRASTFEALPSAERERWERDRPLLGVAGRARGERFARALERMSAP